MNSNLEYVTVKDSFNTQEIKGNQGFSRNKVSISEKINSTALGEEYKLNRFVDVVVGLGGLLVFLLFFPIAALGIKISSPGPVLFKQPRTGKRGKNFYCFKFRTMHLVELKQEDGKPIVTKIGDKRIFKFGHFLRKTNLDELPQILNVFRGEMSLVGPRPYPVEECKHWNNTFDDFFYRYMVKPGITGHAQATGFRGGTLDEEHMRQRLDKDLIYVQKQSFWMDIKILFLTVKQMVTFNTNAH